MRIHIRAVDRVHGAPLVEPVIVGTHRPGQPWPAAAGWAPAPIHAYTGGDNPDLAGITLQ